MCLDRNKLLKSCFRIKFATSRHLINFAKIRSSQIKPAVGIVLLLYEFTMTTGYLIGDDYNSQRIEGRLYFLDMLATI